MNNIDEYYLSNIGRTESFISIEFIKILQKLDTNEFIKIYKISNFWKGKIFIKRLINKNFKYKLNQRMIWDSKFWDKIDIQIIKSRIHFKKETCNEKFFSKLKPKRRKDILKYQLMIKNDIDLSDYLLDEGVVVVPGEVFGCSNFFRISFATSNENIVEGCKKIISACKKLK